MTKCNDMFCSDFLIDELFREKCCIFKTLAKLDYSGGLGEFDQEFVQKNKSTSISLFLYALGKHFSL